MLRSIAGAEKALQGDRMECVARWRRFLVSKDRPEWARPHFFAEGLGQWSESQPNDEPPLSPAVAAQRRDVVAMIRGGIGVQGVRKP
jgi:hypothetical protein